MTELSVMLLSGTLVEGATVVVGVDGKKSALKYDVDLSMVSESERHGKKLKPDPDLKDGGPIAVELDDADELEDFQMYSV